MSPALFRRAVRVADLALTEPELAWPAFGATYARCYAHV